MKKCSPLATALTFCLLVLLLASVAFAVTANWISNQSDTWHDPSRWDTVAIPNSNDNVQHLSQPNHIQVDMDESCHSFLGQPDSNGDRYLLVESSDTLSVKAGGLSSNDNSAHFVVRMQSGTSTDPTLVEVGDSGSGNITRIDFRDNNGSGSGEYIKIHAKGDVVQSSMDFSDNIRV